MLPNFLVIGAAKAGTTSLYRYLEQHPEVYMSPIKEPNFFALEGQPLDFCGPGDAAYIRRFSVTDRAAYEALFDGVRGEVAVGEASALYLYSPAAPLNICRYAPRMKLIAILRHPVERAYSAFLHLLRDEREPVADFAGALGEEKARVQRGWEHIWHYRRMGFYAEQLARYYRHFSREQLRVYRYEALRDDPERLIADIFEFLGVDPDFTPDMSVRHNAPGLEPAARPPLCPAVRRRLLAHYRDPTLELQELLELDLGNWFR
jgi:hypothetical protein